MRLVVPKALRLLVAIATLTFPIVALAAPAQAAGPSDFVTWVNNLRGSIGLAPLAVDSALTSVAQQWANHMASTGVLKQNPNLATQAPTGWTKMGESIGDAYSLAGVYTALVAVTSAGLANLVDPSFNRTGVGIATDSHGQVWVAEDFADYPPPPSATFVFPTSGAVIFPSAQAFSWQQVPGATNYYLTVGSSRGASDFLNSGLLPSNQLSYMVPALPGSQPLWARIVSSVQGIWTYTDVGFSVTGPNTAAFVNPAAGATNVSAAQPFTWSPVASASYYGLTVGTTKGGFGLVNTGPLPASQTSYTVASLPSGKSLWARIYSYIDGSWTHYSDASFTTASH